MRWINRKNAWEKATEVLKLLRDNDSDEVRMLILNLAKYSGYWSCWMEVFKEDVDMRRRLIENFLGTCSDCFDIEGLPISRQDGTL